MRKTEKTETFPINSLHVQLKSLRFRERHQTKTKSTRCNSTQVNLLFWSTYLRIQVLSHTTHAQSRGRRRLPTWSLDAQGEKAKPKARRWRKPPLTHVVHLPAQPVWLWLLVCNFKQAKTAGKLPLRLLPLLLLRWLDGRGLRIYFTASNDTDRSLFRNYSLA